MLSLPRPLQSNYFAKTFFSPFKGTFGGKMRKSDTSYPYSFRTCVSFIKVGTSSLPNGPVGLDQQWMLACDD